jgi:hypothetical protein
MRRLFLLCLGFLAAIPSLSAHVLIQEADIGAVLHIEPNDAPVAGQKATFHLTVRDRQGRFTNRTLRGWFVLRDGETVLVRLPLGQGRTDDGLTAVFQGTFPRAGVYGLELIGDPVSGMPEFHLKHSIRVEVEGTSPSSFPGKDGQVRLLIQTAVPVLAAALLLLTLWSTIGRPASKKRRES